MSTLLVENIKHEDATDIAIVLAADGTLGIGTVGTARNDPLTVKGLNNIAKFESSAAAVELRISTPTVDKIGLTTGTSDNFFINVGGSDRLYVANGGNVGIGTLTPEQKLHVNGITKSNTGLMFGGTESYLYESSADVVTLRVGSNGPYMRLGSDNGEIGNSSGTTRLIAGTGGSELVLTTSGNVGIGGDPTSTYGLEIKKDQTGAGLMLHRTGDAVMTNSIFNAYQITQSNGQSARLAEIVAEGVSGWGGDLVFNTKRANGVPNNSATESMRIKADGTIVAAGSMIASGAVLAVHSTVVNARNSTNDTNADGTGGDLGLRVDLTPKSSNSKFLVILHIGIGTTTSGNSWGIILSRNGTRVGNGDFVSNHRGGVWVRSVDHAGNNGSDVNHGVGAHATYLDTTSGTAGVSMRFEARGVTESGGMYINRVDSDYTAGDGSGSEVVSAYTTSSLVVMEIEK